MSKLLNNVAHDRELESRHLGRPEARQLSMARRAFGLGERQATNKVGGATMLGGPFDFGPYDRAAQLLGDAAWGGAPCYTEVRPACLRRQVTQALAQILTAATRKAGAVRRKARSDGSSMRRADSQSWSPPGE